MMKSSIRTVCTEKQHCCMLLVEDDEHVIRLFGNYFQDPRVGIKLVVLNNLKDALLEAYNIDVEIILLDLGLPDSQGVATIERVVEATGERIPVIAITGSHELEEEAFAAGARDFLIKPLDTRDIIGRVKWAILNQRTINRMRDYCAELEHRIEDLTRIEDSGALPLNSEGLEGLRAVREKLKAQVAEIRGGN